MNKIEWKKMDKHVIIIVISALSVSAINRIYEAGKSVGELVYYITK